MVIFVDNFRDESIDDYRSIVTLPRSTMIRMITVIFRTLVNETTLMDTMTTENEG